MYPMLIIESRIVKPVVIEHGVDGDIGGWGKREGRSCRQEDPSNPLPIIPPSLAKVYSLPARCGVLARCNDDHQPHQHDDRPSSRPRGRVSDPSGINGR